MGHGDRLVLADAFFPAYRLGPPVIEAAGLRVEDLLDAILELMFLDQYVPEPLTMMSPVEGDQADPSVADGYVAVVRRHQPERARIRFIDRNAFYGEAAASFAIVLTGTTSTYANLIVDKGVTHSQ